MYTIKQMFVTEIPKEQRSDILSRTSDTCRVTDLTIIIDICFFSQQFHIHLLAV